MECGCAWLVLSGRCPGQLQAPELDGDAFPLACLGTQWPETVSVETPLYT